MEAFRNSGVFQATELLNSRDLKKVYAVVVLQSLMGFIDLAGIAAIGILGSLTVTGLQSKGSGDRVTKVLDLLNLNNMPFQTQVIYLGVGAALILFSRTILSILFTRRMLFFLSHKGAKASADLISKLLSQPLMLVKKTASQRTLYAVTEGVSKIMLGVIGHMITIIADVSLLIVIIIGLIIVDPILAAGTVFVFLAIGFLLYGLLSSRVKRLGRKNTELFINSNEKILEVLITYREAIVRNRRDYYARQIGSLRLQLGEVLAENAFVPYISKYVIESSIVLGALLISAVQFFRQDASHAIATLAIFLAAGMRIAPAVLRIQQGMLVIKGNLSSCAPTFELMKELRDTKVIAISADFPVINHSGFMPNIEAKAVSFAYPGSESDSISKISLEIAQGSFVGIVGPTGAGKTTAVDLLLGVLEPHEGTISISGIAPNLAIVKWPGAISYVPQDVVIVNGTIRQNVGLGFDLDFIDDDLVWESLNTAQLSDYVKTLPKGLETQVGEHGSKMSGGQRQRLGIARALFTRPKLLILDEATSSLDGDTEFSIAKAIGELKGTVTIVMIAHRLSTVRDADLIIYLDSGRLISSGSFEEVRTSVPDFDRQAKLMGL
jgi:ABC-type multidrug transport system fused ATPase/permease subunit